MRVGDSAMRDEQMMTRHHRPRWRRGGHPQLLAFGGGPPAIGCAACGSWPLMAAR